MKQPKCLADGRAFINLGCGHRAHPAWSNLDFSIYARIKRHMAFVRWLKRIGIISTARFDQFALIPEDVIVWDLRAGIPFEEGTFDLVYHSHLLEHMAHEDALALLHECRRVLKRGGLLRVVVPDLESWARSYTASLELQPCCTSTRKHEQIVADLLAQLSLFARQIDQFRRFKRRNIEGSPGFVHFEL